MVRIDKSYPVIDIQLENGIYVFDNLAATGKTRLYKELRKYQIYEGNVASYSYNDYLLGMPIESVLVSSKYKVIMLDRYDMYNGVGADLIRSCKDESIILIDCKRWLKFNVEYEFCAIEMTNKLIEVFE